jgi:hypothetical protein
MKFPLALCSLIALSFATAPAADETAAPTSKPSLLDRVLHPFGGGKGKPPKEKTVNKLVVEMKLDPQPLKLSSTNRLKVTLTLINRTKKLVPLEFPTSQRIEVLLKTNAGKLVEQWSQDQAFNQEVSVVTINPGERVEYVVEVATRDLVAGQTYVVEGFFPNHELLKVEKTIVPEK